MIELSPTDKFLISLTLSDGETDKGVVALIFNDQGQLLTTPDPIILTHIQNGLYMNASTTLTMPVGAYVVQAFVYTDTTLATLDSEYGVSEERYMVNEGAQEHNDLQESLTNIYEAIQLLKQADLELQFSEYSN